MLQRSLASLWAARREFRRSLGNSPSHGCRRASPLSEGAKNIDVIANQPAGWCGDPFSLSLVERHDPRGRLCAEGTRKAPPCRGYGLPRQCAHWLAMTWFFDTLSPLREGAKASFSAFHNFKFLIRIKEEGFFEISVTYSSFSASIFQKQTTERRISYESHVSLCGLFRVGDAAVFVPVCQRPAGMKFFRNPVTFFHRDASIL